MGPEGLSEVLEKREEVIQQSIKDPFTMALSLPIGKWQMKSSLNVMNFLFWEGTVVVKAEYASKRVVKCINDIPEANVLCMHTTASTSIEQQQQYIWKYIPSEWKAAKKGKVTNMTFSKKGGFTESCCVAPNGSRIFSVITRRI